MLQILSFIVSIVGLVFFVITLIKLFQEKGVLHGILGIICGLYTFIWGWMNVKRHNSMAVMGGWTAAIVVSLLLNFLQLRSV